MSVKLATYLLIRGGISKEVTGVRCWTAPGSLENPRFLQLMLAQCSNTLGLTPHCLAPETNTVKHRQKVSVKHCLLWIRGLESPCCRDGSDGKHWKTTGHLLYLSWSLAGLSWCGNIRIRSEKPVKDFFSGAGCWRCWRHKGFAMPMASLPANSSRTDPATPEILPAGETPLWFHSHQAARRKKPYSASFPQVLHLSELGGGSTSPLWGQNNLRVPVFNSVRPTRSRKQRRDGRAPARPPLSTFLPSCFHSAQP